MCDNESNTLAKQSYKWLQQIILSFKEIRIFWVIIIKSGSAPLPEISDETNENNNVDKSNPIKNHKRTNVSNCSEMIIILTKKEIYKILVQRDVCWQEMWDEKWTNHLSHLCVRVVRMASNGIAELW